MRGDSSQPIIPTFHTWATTATTTRVGIDGGAADVPAATGDDGTHRCDNIDDDGDDDDDDVDVVSGNGVGSHWCRQRGGG